jgi:hypothetical protein
MVIIPLILLSTLYEVLTIGEEKNIFISYLGAILIIPVPFERRRTRAVEFETLPYSYPDKYLISRRKATFTER